LIRPPPRSGHAWALDEVAAFESGAVTDDGDEVVR
jgi:hypothetical protein